MIAPNARRNDPDIRRENLRARLLPKNFIVENGSDEQYRSLEQ